MFYFASGIKNASRDCMTLEQTMNESYTPHHATLRFAGRDCTKYFLKNLTDRRYSFIPFPAREFALDISEKLRCSVLNYDTAQSIDKEKTCEFTYGNVIIVAEFNSTADSAKEKVHGLFDGNIINFGVVRFRCVEVLPQSFSVQNFVWSTTLLSRVTWRETWTSCCQAARPCSNPQEVFMRSPIWAAVCMEFDPVSEVHRLFFFGIELPTPMEEWALCA